MIWTGTPGGAPAAGGCAGMLTTGCGAGGKASSSGLGLIGIPQAAQRGAANPGGTGWLAPQAGQLN